MNKRKKGIIATVIFTLVAILYVSPLFIVLMNSFKKKAFINLEPFKLPSEKTFIGAENYVNAVDKYGFLQAVIWTVVITVGSVLVILLCTSMFAWYITRVKSRTTKLLYLLCVFSMVVPFQMVMFTLSLVTDRLRLNTPWGLVIIYLGFGAGLAVFMFCGFVKSIPLEIEEAAMIDGCGPIRCFFLIVFPLIRPMTATIVILDALAVFNDFSLPMILISAREMRTIPLAISSFFGTYLSDWNLIMAALTISVVPVLVFFLTFQKNIMSGLAEGALKG